jgi:hypothetical protein
MGLECCLSGGGGAVSVFGAIIAYLFTQGAVGTGDDQFVSLFCPLKVEAFETSRQLRFQNLTLSCQGLFTE